VEFKVLANINRLKDIAAVLLRFGFKDLVERIDLPGVSLPEPAPPSTVPSTTEERVRLVLDALGPTFVKFGQIMSLRPDLLPASMIRELGKLQDHVGEVDFEDIREVVEQACGDKLETVFAVFDRTPIAAASIAQVHRAVLRKEGDIVSVKIRRPGIRRTLDTDMDILEYIANRLHANFEPLHVYDLPALAKHVRRTLRREMDLRREARNLNIARSYLKKNGDVRVPSVFEAYSAETILVNEVPAPPGRYSALSWKMVPAADGPAAGYPLVIKGTASKDGQSVPFTLKFNEELAFTCGDYVGDDRKGILQPGGSAEMEATFHFDHLFGDGEAAPDDEINTGALGFEPIAAMATDGSVDADLDTLQAQLSEAEYQQLMEILPNLAHVGEGHCTETQMSGAEG